MIRIIIAILIATPVIADTLEVITDDATGAVVSTVRVVKSGDHGHGDRPAGRTCSWFDDADNPTGAFDADNVPQLRLVNGKIRARLKADIDADVAKIRAKERAARKITARAQRIAADAVAAELPNDPDIAAAAAKAREDEAR